MSPYRSVVAANADFAQESSLLSQESGQTAEGSRTIAKKRGKGTSDVLLGAFGEAYGGT